MPALSLRALFAQVLHKLQVVANRLLMLWHEQFRYSQTSPIYRCGVSKQSEPLYFVLVVVGFLACLFVSVFVFVLFAQTNFLRSGLKRTNTQPVFL